MKSKIAIAFYIIVTLVPIVAGLGYSFLYSIGLAGLLGKGFTLEHWATLLSDAETWKSLAYTSMLTLASLILALLPAMALAYALHFRRNSKLLYKTLFLPLTLPPLIAGFAIYHLLNPAGFIARLTYQFGWIKGIEDFPRLVNDGTGWGIIATHILLIAPFFTLVFFNLSQKENMQRLRQMSQTLGATEGHFLRKIWLPLIFKRASTLILLYSVFLFGMYEVPLLLGRSSPRAVTIFIVEKVSKYDLSGIPVGHAMVVLYALFVGLLATMLILRKKRQSRLQ